MSCVQEDRLFNSVISRGTQVDSGIIGRLRECAVYEVCIEILDRAFLAFLASEGHRSMRAALLARINSVVMPLKALYYNALIASEVDAIELTYCTLAGDTAFVLAYRFKVYSQRAARDLSDMLLLHFDEHQFPAQPTTKYWRVADMSFSLSTVRVPLSRFPPGSTLPSIRTALSTTLPPPSLNLSLTPGSQGQFSCFTRASSSHQASPAPFGNPSHLTEAANAATASREQSRQSGFLQSLELLALNARVRASDGASAVAGSSARLPRQSCPPAAPAASPKSPPHAPLAAAAAATPQPAAQPASAVVPPQAAAQAPSHATPSPLDSNPSPDRAEASLFPAGANSSSTPAPSPAPYPIALSRAEYHAHYAVSHPPRGRKNESVPAPAVSDSAA